MLSNNLTTHQPLKNNTHSDSKDKILDNVQFVKVISMPAVGEHLTAKNYVDQTISNKVFESPLLKLKIDPDEKSKQADQDPKTVNSTLT